MFGELFTSMSPVWKLQKWKYCVSKWPPVNFVALQLLLLATYIREDVKYWSIVTTALVWYQTCRTNHVKATTKNKNLELAHTKWRRFPIFLCKIAISAPNHLSRWHNQLPIFSKPETWKVQLLKCPASKIASSFLQKHAHPLLRCHKIYETLEDLPPILPFCKFACFERL